MKKILSLLAVALTAFAVIAQVEIERRQREVSRKQTGTQIIISCEPSTGSFQSMLVGTTVITYEDGVAVSSVPGPSHAFNYQQFTNNILGGDVFLNRLNNAINRRLTNAP